MRPFTFKPKEHRVVFFDFKTGKGFTSAGQPVTAHIDSRRKTPALHDLLNAAGNIEATWIMLTGTEPKVADGQPHYLMTETPEWEHGTHYLSDEPTGRYVRILTGQKILVTYASGWFGTMDYNPYTLAKAWGGITWYIKKHTPGLGTPMESPAATGANMWAQLVGKNLDDVPPLDNFIAEQLHSTSGQHHIDHLVSGPVFSKHNDCIPLIDSNEVKTLSKFSVIDGRFMYASLCRELGVGPVQELRRDAAADLLRENPYAKARYRVKFKVPDNWEHIGIFGVQDTSDKKMWHYPNRPGATGETWADHREILVAQEHGWIIDPQEAIRFTEGHKPLDSYASRIDKIRADVDRAVEGGSDPVVGKAISAAFRNVLIHSIGRFAKRGREITKTASSFNDIPEECRSTALRQGNEFSYVQRQKLNDRDMAYYHPELAAQVWGLSRARLLESPSAFGQKTAGVLHLDPRTVIAVQGDAVYTTDVPLWSLPESLGGGDDGRTGRLRLKGVLEGTAMRTPRTFKQRVDLGKKAERAGLEALYRGKQ